MQKDDLDNIFKTVFTAVNTFISTERMQPAHLVPVAASGTKQLVPLKKQIQINARVPGFELVTYGLARSILYHPTHTTHMSALKMLSF